MALSTASARWLTGVVVFDEFVLAEIDVRNGDRQQERLEHVSGSGMISGEERCAVQA